MPNSVSFTITGLEQLQDKLNRLPAEYSRKVLRKSLRTPGNVFKKAIQALAKKRTGWMASHVTVRVKTNNLDEGEVRVSFSRKARPGSGGKSLASAIYEALYKEFGTVKEPAQPFIRPAFESSKGQALDEFVNDLRDELTSTFK